MTKACNATYKMYGSAGVYWSCDDHGSDGPFPDFESALGDHKESASGHDHR